ncbi:phosphoglycolate phosphatase-like HAD superfamily hydrolase [Alkalihalobacillus xiaoxiensis]|uniref:Phosphoglycolate phosphatase-like HAD superfamily hydrolase n=1 Tax=Shouchella xiaoxiensis TaxID=766895 RepID=A0ABS2SWU0_9BACI|nr:phosphoglycolate phosphatase-like HAD superfamily hydrolase [Shouchella xiaoxiensis]
MTTKKVIMFDLDGTLSDPKDGILRSVDYALNQMGIQQEGEELLSFIGPPLQDSFKDHFSFTENEVHTAIKLLPRTLSSAWGMKTRFIQTWSLCLTR